MSYGERVQEEIRLSLKGNTMNYCFSVVYQDRIFHITLGEGENAEISAAARADLVIPDFGHVLALHAEGE